MINHLRRSHSTRLAIVEALEPICLFDVEPIDPGFGNNGTFVTDLGSGGQKYLSKILVQPDGKILVSSDREFGINPNGLSPLIRLNADGTLDKTFGQAGQALLFGGTDAIVRIKGMALDSQGRIIVTGDTTGAPYGISYVTERFLADGSPDNSFGNQGTVVYSPPGGTDNGDDTVVSVAIDGQGRILVGGNADGEWAVVRLLANGTPDSTFGADGFASMNASGVLQSMLPAPSGDIYAVGTDISAADGYRMTAIRLLGDGSPDPAFGQGGVIYRVPHLQGSDSTAMEQSAMVRSDGGLLIAGMELNATLPLADADVYSVMPDGSADPTFGTGGLVATSLGGGFSNPETMILRADGTLVVAGSFGVGQTASALEAFNTDGTPLATFGTNGVLDISEFSNIAYMTQDAQGRILLGGNLDAGFTQVEIGRYVPFPILEVGTEGAAAASVSAHVTSAVAAPPVAPHAIVSAAVTAPQFVLSRTGDLSKPVSVTVLFTGIGSNGKTQGTDNVSVTFPAKSVSASLLLSTYGPLVLQGQGTVQLSVNNPGTLVVLGSASAKLAYTAPISLGTISGTVFNDVNLDGKYDTGDILLAGRTVFIDKNDNGKLDTGETSALTNSSGNFSFTKVAAGTYRVAVVVPSGYRLTTGSSAYYNETLNAGQSVGSLNFLLTTKAGLSGTLYNDVNLDGKYDTGDILLAGRTVFVDKNDNGKLDSGETSVLTNSSGNYNFNLAAGTYRVAAVVPSGYRLTSGSPAYFNVTLAAGGISSGKSFALTTTALLSGTLFNDLNGNGAQNTGETALSGWKVFIDTNDDGKWESIERYVLTTSTGAWSFNLVAGKYHVNVVPPAGWKLTTPAATTTLRTLAAAQVQAGVLLGAKKG